jgi:hypothetical protein
MSINFRGYQITLQHSYKTGKFSGFAVNDPEGDYATKTKGIYDTVDKAMARIDGLNKSKLKFKKFEAYALHYLMDEKKWKVKTVNVLRFTPRRGVVYCEIDDPKNQTELRSYEIERNLFKKTHANWTVLMRVLDARAKVAEAKDYLAHIETDLCPITRPLRLERKL